MTRDPLQTLLRLRLMALDAARASLVEQQERAQHADAQAKAADAMIAQEMAAASRLDVGDGAVEAFGAWLPRGRAERAKARARAERAESDTVQARARLTSARAAVEAVETLLKQRADERAAEAMRRQQAVLDEAGQRRRPSNSEL